MKRFFLRIFHRNHEWEWDSIEIPHGYPDYSGNKKVKFVYKCQVCGKLKKEKISHYP